MHRAGLAGVSGTAAQPLFALTCGLLAIAASLWHLGRPLYAFRAVIGLRHSWLSREIVAFGLYSAAATAYALACWGLADRFDATPRLRHGLGTAVVLTGLAGVFCSAMIYHVVKRPSWHLARTLPKFLLTAILLGSAATLVVLTWSAPFGSVPAASRDALCRAMLYASLAKLALEALALSALRDRQLTPLRRSALLMTGPLANTTLARFAAGLFGGVVLPLLLVTPDVIAAPGMTIAAATAALLACLAGELAERYLFFAATVAPKMPGGLTP
jgi:DMSO reductase anchor subunit